MRWAVILLLLSRVAAAEPASDSIKLGGYLEMYDQWNFGVPSNGVSQDTLTAGVIAWF